MPIYKSLVSKISIPPNKKTKQKDYLKKGVLPIIDQGKELIGGYSDNAAMLLECNLPVIVFGDHTRAVKFVNFPFGAGADGIKVLQPKDNICPKYLYYGTQYLVLRLENKGYARHYQHIEKKELRLPTFTEQQRIVSRIEELFSTLDASVAELQTAKERLKVYRQAVLHAVFKNCEYEKARMLCYHITDGDHMPPPKAAKGIPFVMISNIENNSIKWSNTNFVDTDYYNRIGEKRTPQRGDILYTVTGSYGIPIKVDFDKPFCFQRHIALLRPNKRILQDFLFYALQSPSVFQQATKRATGTAQKTVGLTVLRDMDIPFVNSIDAQMQILSEIESRLSICDSIEKTVDTTLQQAEAMRQSILKQAFEGRLV